tara:strand:+ start:41 stop:574 length:534 start_codon:yes stop_codon:yes gene_type:complete
MADDDRSGLQKMLDLKDQRRERGQVADTLDALTWNQWDGEEMNAMGSANISRYPSSQKRDLAARSDSVMQSWRDTQDQWHNDREMGRDAGGRPPHWRNGGDDYTQASWAQVMFDDAKQDSTRNANQAPYSPSQKETMSTSLLNGGHQQALGQNGVVWINGRKWARSPWDSSLLEEVE